MKGTISNAGKVTITFDSQCEILKAPGNKKYLPCEKCGQMLEVNLNVVSQVCPECYRKIKFKPQI